MDPIKIIFIPLDNRPVNYQYPLFLAKVAGIKLITPPKNFLGDFTKTGEGGKIGKWLLTKVDEAQGLIVSVDMLAYGGLISSRKMGVSFNGALNRLRVLKKIRESSSFGRKIIPFKIYGFNILMRLSTSVVDEKSLKLYDMIFKFSILVDKVKVEKDKKDKKELERLTKEIPSSLLEDYLTVRKRNHYINLEMIKWTEEGVFDYLIIAQEDSAVYGLHRQEKEKIKEEICKRGVEERISLHCGTDEVAMVLISRYINQIRDFSPRFFILPSYPKGEEMVPLYEDRKFKIAVQDNIKVIGARCVETPNSADIILALYLPEDTQQDLLFIKERERSRKYLSSFIIKINEFLRKGYKIALADLYYANGADEELVRSLQDRIDITKLTSFSGWNTASNTIGSLVAATTLLWGRGISAAQYLLLRFLDDFCYQSQIRLEINNYIKENLPVSIWNLNNYKSKIEEKISFRMRDKSLEFFEKNFKDKIISNEGKRYIITNLKNLKFNLPWPRTFEIMINFDIEGEII